MNKLKIKKTLSNGFFDELNIHNTLDAVNGIKVDLTSSDKEFEYTEAYEAMDSLVDILAKSLAITAKPNVYSRIPSEDEIESSDLLSIFSIGINYPRQATLKLHRSKLHIHGFIYGIHKFNKKIDQFLFEVDSGIKKTKYFKSKNRHSVFIKPLHDKLDTAIRKESSIQPLIEYVNNPRTGTWMNYQKNVNSNQMLYYLS